MNDMTHEMNNDTIHDVTHEMNNEMIHEVNSIIPRIMTNNN